jgi:hypothetical protein
MKSDETLIPCHLQLRRPDFALPRTRQHDEPLQLQWIRPSSSLTVLPHDGILLPFNIPLDLTPKYLSY